MPQHLFVRFREDGTGSADSSVMLRRIRAFDWSRSSAGPIETWPDELKFAVRLMLLSASAMTVLIGREGIVVYNDAAREIFGDYYEGALGQPAAEALPAGAGLYEKAIAACYEGKGVRFPDEPIRLFRNGAWETAWFSLGFNPIADERANIFGTLMIVSETTERMRALKALEQSRQRMELALDAGGIVGTWDLDVTTRQVTLEGSVARLFGVSSEEAIRGVSNDILSTSVHPEDRERVLGTLDAAIANGSDYRCRYRAVTSEGHVRWFVVSGRPIKDDWGRTLQLAGIVIDVTEQTEAAAALEQSNLRFDILAESIPQIVWSTDAAGRHDYFNHRWTEFTGIGPDDIEPTTWQGLVHPDDWQRVFQTWQECLLSGKTYDIDYRFRHRDGSYRWLKVLALPLRDASGQIVRWYGTSTDIDAAKQLEAQRELVANELDHRIKNLFALVNGLVALSVREDPSLRPAAETLRSRLTALHQAHSLIRENADEQGRSLRSLLLELLKPYRPQEPDRIVIDGPDAPIDPGSVTSIALVFHELITNAAKYGALSGPDGSLLIRLFPNGSRQIVEWQEKAVRGPHSKASEGFGSRLLKTIVEGQLHGTFVRDLSDRGLRVRIEIPQAALRAADAGE